MPTTIAYDPAQIAGAIEAGRMVEAVPSEDGKRLAVRFDNIKEEPLVVAVKAGALDLVPERSSRHARLVAALSA
jgi:hypothetical protein